MIMLYKYFLSSFQSTFGWFFLKLKMYILKKEMDRIQEYLLDRNENVITLLRWYGIDGITRLLDSERDAAALLSKLNEALDHYYQAMVSMQAFALEKDFGSARARAQRISAHTKHGDEITQCSLQYARRSAFVQQLVQPSH